MRAHSLVSSALACLVAALCSPARAQAPSAPAPAAVSFITCPIYRDTDAGRKSGCWLADDPVSGTRYDVTLGPVKPQVGRMLWVEGILANEPETACGGRVLAPVRVAVLPEPCPRSLLPAEGHPGRPYKSPPEQLRPADEPRTPPAPPYEPRSFSIYFEFGRDFLIYQYAELIIEKIVLYARASQASVVTIDGYAATEPVAVPTPFGLRQLREPAALAQARADMVAEALRRLGVPGSTLRITAHHAPDPTPDLEAGQLPEASKRRVLVTVTP